MGGVLISIHALFSSFASPAIGSISDKFGRKRILIITIIGSGAAYMMLATAHTLQLIFLSRIIAGTMAGNLGVTQAAILDTATEHEQAKALSLMSATYAAGYIAGPVFVVASSLILDDVVPITCVFAAAMSFIGALILHLNYNPKTNMFKVSERAYRTKSINFNFLKIIAPTLIILCIFSICFSGVNSMTGYWLEASFSWDEKQLSILLAIISLCVVFSQAIILPYLFDKFSLSLLLLFSITLCCLTTILLIFQWQNIIVMIISVGLIIISITNGQTILTAILARNTRPVSRARIMSYGVSISGLGRVLGPIIFGALFVKVSINSPFSLILVLMIISIAILSAQFLRTRI